MATYTANNSAKMETPMRVRSSPFPDASFVRVLCSARKNANSRESRRKLGLTRAERRSPGDVV